MRLVREEIAFMSSLHHPNLLPLLDATFEISDTSPVTAAYMLFPLYEVR